MAPLWRRHGSRSSTVNWVWPTRLVALHLFAVLHSLRARGPEAAPLAQALTDRFSADMDAVLRELGLSDLKVPKAMRVLAASGRATVERYSRAMPLGTDDLSAAIAELVPFRDASALSIRSLASYVTESCSRIDRQSLAELQAGKVDYAEPIETL